MQIVTIDLIPQKEKPIVKLSQYDNNRQVRFMLKENGEPYTLAGTETVEVNIRKPDRNIVVIAPTIGANAYVDVLFTEQSAACFGESFGEISIKSGETVIGTCNFIIEVEISPIYGGINSTTEINNLTTQVEDIVTEVLSDNYYTKSQTDTLLSAKANASDVYTKSQTDVLLDAKANASDVYTKSQTDVLLDAKANASDVYTKSQTDVLLDAKANASDVYTKAQVDGIIMDIMPVDTASGPIATFNTELAAHLVNVSCDIVATGGNGTPQNPIPINGYTEANITRCGVNLWDEEWEKGSIDPTTGATFNDPARIRSKNFSPIKGGVEIYTIDPTNNYNIRLFYYDVNKNYIGGSMWLGNQTSTTLAGACYFKFIMGSSYGTTYNHDISVLYPSSEHNYYSYTGNTYTVSFGQTVYGGVLDVTRGKLKPCIEYPSYNGETLSGRWLSSEATYIEGTTPPTGSQVVSLDDYGSDIDLTPEVISAVVGTNNVYSDTNGDTTVQFKDSIQHYIDTRV